MRIDGLFIAALTAITLDGAACLHAEAAVNLTETEGKLECPDLNNSDECARRYEASFLQQHPDLIHRDGHTLSIKLLNGGYFRLEEKDSTFTVLDVTGPFVAIREQFYEGDSWHILDLRNGLSKEVWGYPLFSPDQKRFACAATDLDAGYSQTVFDVYEVKSKGIAAQFEANLAENPSWGWGPAKVRWNGNDEIDFMIEYWDKTNSMAQDPAKLVWNGKHWALIRLSK